MSAITDGKLAKYASILPSMSSKEAVLRQLKIEQLKITSLGTLSTDVFCSKVEGHKLTNTVLQNLHVQKGLGGTKFTGLYVQQ